ncbi:MAG: hypothetical protein JWR18_1401 [Segetibacter sp.]|jgi:hypothetical protein|nr:hypothetical protein [Segetibacter sp.]
MQTLVFQLSIVVSLTCTSSSEGSNQSKILSKQHLKVLAGNGMLSQQKIK